MKLTTLTTALTLGAFALASPTLEERATSCNNADINFIQRNQNSPVAYCYSYLSGPKKTASYYALKAPAVSNACGCITASATACTATKTKTHTVTETAVLTVKKTSTQTKTATAWRTTTQVRYSTVVRPTTITKTIVSVSVSIQPTTPTGCKVVSCAKSTVISTATATIISTAISTLTPKCSQTCSVRSCPQSILTSTKAASTVVSLSTVKVEKTIYASTPAVQISTLTLQGDVSTVTQYSTISSCPSSASNESSFPTYSIANTTSAASSTAVATTSALDLTTSTTSSTSTAASSTACTSSGNLLVNGGFETGSLSSWTLTNGAMTVTSPGHESNNSLLYQSQQYNQYVTITQTIATVPGAKYNFTMQMMATSNDEDFEAWAWCKTPSHPTIAFSAFERLSYSDSGKWITNTGELVAVNDTTTIECLFNKEQAAGVFMVDDLYLGCA